jgi:hypothetical protein
MNNRNWAIGESVVVNPGVTDLDTGRKIDGWQGRIRAILDGGNTLTIQWDSFTLKSLPPRLLGWVKKEGMSWSEVRYEKRIYAFPLCELSAPDAAPETQQLIKDYTLWFANNR